MSEPIGAKDFANIQEIIRLNDEALAFDSDCAKSSEGSIRLSIDFGTYWDRFEPTQDPEVSVEIYAYVLGPERRHTFSSTEEALAAMREWHKNHIEGEWRDD